LFFLSCLVFFCKPWFFCHLFIMSSGGSCLLERQRRRKSCNYDMGGNCSPVDQLPSFATRLLFNLCCFLARLTVSAPSWTMPQLFFSFLRTAYEHRKGLGLMDGGDNAHSRASGMRASNLSARMKHQQPPASPWPPRQQPPPQQGSSSPTTQTQVGPAQPGRRMRQ